MGKVIAEKATGKYTVFFLMYVAFCISYLDRTAINIALSSIGKEFQLSPSVMGAVLSTFFISYSLMQLPGGWLADKFGSKKVIVVSLFFWSLFTMTTGLAWSLASLIAIRFLFGIGEGAFPCSCIKGLAEYFPKTERAKTVSAMMSSNYVGSAIAPMLVAPLLIYCGWRNMFYAIGLVGILFVVVYYFLVHQKLANREQDAPGETKLSKISMKSLLETPVMWHLVIAWFGLSLVNKGLDSWMPTYLLTVRHLDLKAVGMLTPLPFIAVGISTAIGGWIMDRFFEGREKYLLCVSALLTAFFLYFMAHAQSVMMVIAFQSLVYFFKGFVFASVFALPMKLLPGEVMGSASGMIQLGGQSAGFIAPLVIGLMVSLFNGSYDAAFWFLIGASCLSALASITIRNRTVVNAEAAAKEEQVQ